MTAHHYMIVTVMDLKAKEPELDGWGVQWNQGREIRERERDGKHMIPRLNNQGRKRAK
jgi:hypothetical protein